MNWKTIEQIAQNTDKKWYLNQKEVAIFLGCTRQMAAQFLTERSVPPHYPTKRAVYFLPEIIEALERSRWKHYKGA